MFFSAGLRGLSYPHSIVVNDAGRRFCDESQFQHVVAALTRFDLKAHRHPNLPAFMLCDAQFFRRYRFGNRPIGAPVPFSRPNTRSCSCRVVRSHSSMRIRMRRATR